MVALRHGCRQWSQVDGVLPSKYVVMRNTKTFQLLLAATAQTPPFSTPLFLMLDFSQPSLSRNTLVLIFVHFYCRATSVALCLGLRGRVHRWGGTWSVDISISPISKRYHNMALTDTGAFAIHPYWEAVGVGVCRCEEVGVAGTIDSAVDTFFSHASVGHCCGTAAWCEIFGLGGVSCN